MSVRRLFAEALPAEGGVLTLSKEAARHARVLRVEAGHAVELFDGEGQRAAGRVLSADAAGLVCELSAPTTAPEPSPRVHLVLGAPKAGALDDAVRGATEAGAYAIHLFESARSVGRDGKLEGRLERLQRVTREAARQSERDRTPALVASPGLSALLAAVPASATRLIAAARDEGAGWGAAGADEVWIAVGPEGGFHPDEERAFADAGFASVSLGPYILRAVTAAPVAVALVLSHQLR